MDLRGKLTPQQIEQAKDFIIRRLLWYQPFIFEDALEVGEGLNFYNSYKGEVASIYWPDAPPHIVTTSDLSRFREGNAGLRRIYDSLIDSLVKELGDISKLSFAEFGCNSGYFLYGLSLRGARQTIGFDFFRNAELFAWFNEVLGTNSEFRWSEWDSLHHTLRHAQFEEVDVTLSYGVTPHLVDGGLYHLPWLADRARKAVFFWVMSGEEEEGLTITFDPAAHRDPDLRFPVNVNSGTKLSRALVRFILRESGFGDIREIDPAEGMDARWREFSRQTVGYLAFRTSDGKTALSGEGYARPVPPAAQPPQPRAARVSGLLRAALNSLKKA